MIIWIPVILGTGMVVSALALFASYRAAVEIRTRVYYRIEHKLL